MKEITLTEFLEKYNNIKINVGNTKFVPNEIYLLDNDGHTYMNSKNIYPKGVQMKSGPCNGILGPIKVIVSKLNGSEVIKTYFNRGIKNKIDVSDIKIKIDPVIVLKLNIKAKL